MTTVDENAFLIFLSESLMYEEEPFKMDVALNELVFDSIGKLMVAAALEKNYEVQASLDDLINCKTPRDIYALIRH